MRGELREERAEQEVEGGNGADVWLEDVWLEDVQL